MVKQPQSEPDVAWTPDPNVKPTRRFLPDPVKHAIVAAVAQGETKTAVAKRFGTTIRTVFSLCAAVRQLPNNPLDGTWRARFRALPELCVGAIEASVTDREDVHRAAGTAQAHLKGVGIYASDAPVTNVFVSQLQNLPLDWQVDFTTGDSAEQGSETTESTPRQLGEDE